MPAPTPLNINQIFTANPITSNTSTDLIYIGQSPFGPTNDAAITFADFAAQFVPSSAGSVTAAQVQNQAFTSAVDSGGANALAITLSRAPSAYAEGQLFVVRAANNNTSTTTLNVNGLGNKAIYTANGNACVGGEIVGGTTYLFEYNGALNAFNIINPSNITINQAPQIQNQKLVYAVDSGAANAYVVTLSPAPGAYVDGMLVSFRATNANSGASTVNVNGLGVKAIVTNANAALSGGEILLNGTYNVEYSSSFSKFVLLNSSASGGGGATPAQIQGQAFTYAVDTGAANALAITLSPAITSYVDGQLFVVRASNTNTNSTTLNVNGVGAANVVLSPGIGCIGGEILNNNTYLFEYNSLFPGFYLINPTRPSATQLQNQAFSSAFDSGTANAYVITLSPPVVSPTNGLLVEFTAANANTGASTLTVNANTAAIVHNDDTDLSPDEILAGGAYQALYNGTLGGFVLLNSSGYPWRAGSRFNSNSVVGPGLPSSSATDKYTLVFGNAVNSNNFHSFAFGNTITSSGFSQYSFVFGNTIAVSNSCDYSFAFGNTITINNAGSWVIGDSNASPNLDTTTDQWNATFANGYKFYINNTPTLALSIDANANVINSAGEADLSKIILTPVNGDTVTLATNQRRTIINPAGPLLSLTVNMPSAMVDGQIQGFSFTQAITALTVSGVVQGIIGNPTTAAAGSSFAFINDTGTSTWYPTD